VLATSSGKVNVTVWHSSICLSHRHTHCDSPGGMMMAVWMMAVWWWWWVCILGIVCQARNNSSSFDQAASSLVTFGENWRRSFAIELFCHWITRLIVLSHATPLRLCKAFLQHSGNSIANQYIFTHITTLHFATVIYVMALLRPSVCHVPELYWNGYTDLAVFLS